MKCRAFTGTQLPFSTQYHKSMTPREHEGIMADHQGVWRTTDRILDFYWSGMRRDIKLFVRCCDLCQKTMPKGKAVAPLGNVPLLRTPFETVVVDLIRPLPPKPDKGNRYVLTLIDFVTRYPDAIALSSMP